jgi:predicted alpha/beta-hydrolase family hydrolase
VAGKRRILLAHGAGAGSSSPWMKRWAAHLGELGRVTTFDHSYIAAGRRLPNARDDLIGTHRAAAKRARGRSKAPFVLAGKSMGARIGCHVSLDTKVDALVCFGYPLLSPSKKSIRDEVLYALRAPILFVQGTKDPLCPLPKLRAVMRKLKAPRALHVVRGGDHSLEVGKRALAAKGETQADVDARILDAVAVFLDTHAG